MNSLLTRDEIIARVIRILKEVFNKEEKQCLKNQHESLFSSTFGFTSRDLLYLFFEIEREFNITMKDNEDICSGNFKTIDQIVETIKKCTVMQGE